jgi:hypothetical protein
MTPTRAWGGLTPDDTPGASTDAAELEAMAPPLSEPEIPEGDASDQDLAQAVQRELRRIVCGTPAQLHPITFVGANKQYVHRSSHPPRALSVGIVNPEELTIYVGLSGERAAPNSHAFLVPPKAAMVVPVEVDKFDIGVDPEALKEGSATIFLLRFQTVQPFFVGKMS